MILITVLVFLGVFAIAVPLMLAFGKSEAKHVEAALDSALAAGKQKSSEPTTNFRKSDLLSTVPWLNTTLNKVNLAPSLQRLLIQANLKWTAGSLILMCLLCFALPAYLVNMQTGAAVFALLCGLVIGFVPLAFVFFKRSKRFGKFEQGLPDALELMVGALRVGHSFNASLGLLARECPDPIGGEFHICFDEQNFGLDIRNSLENLIERVPLPDLKIAVTAILIQKETGGNLAEVLEKTAYVIRERFRLKKQVMVYTAQGRMTGWILTALPIVLGIILFFINPDTISLLWKRPIGIKLLYAGAGMLTLGTLVIQKIIHMDV